MRDRLITMWSIAWRIVVLVVGGMWPLCFMPVADLVHESHGLIGFVFGIIVLASSLATNMIIWVVSGYNLFHEVMMWGIDGPPFRVRDRKKS